MNAGTTGCHCSLLYCYSVMFLHIYQPKEQQLVFSDIISKLFAKQSDGSP